MPISPGGYWFQPDVKIIFFCGDKRPSMVSSILHKLDFSFSGSALLMDIDLHRPSSDHPRPYTKLSSILYYSICMMHNVLLWHITVHCEPEPLVRAGALMQNTPAALSRRTVHRKGITQFYSNFYAKSHKHLYFCVISSEPSQLPHFYFVFSWKPM